MTIMQKVAVRGRLISQISAHGFTFMVILQTANYKLQFCTCFEYELLCRSFQQLSIKFMQLCKVALVDPGQKGTQISRLLLLYRSVMQVSDVYIFPTGISKAHYEVLLSLESIQGVPGNHRTFRNCYVCAQGKSSQLRYSQKKVILLCLWELVPSEYNAENKLKMLPDVISLFTCVRAFIKCIHNYFMQVLFFEGHPAQCLKEVYSNGYISSISADEFIAE